MRKQMIGYIAGLALFLLSGCDSFLTQLSENNTTVANHFRSEADVEAAVYGMHTQFREVMGSFTQDYRDRGLLLDNFGLARWREANEHNFSGYTATAVEFSWMYEYKAVSAANLVIGNLYRAGLPEERYRFYMGQALCIRACLYFQIIRLWGDAPLVLEYEDISEKGRTPWREIAGHIVADLLLAAEYLPPADQLKDPEGKPLTARQIPGRGTAYAILAEVYAWIAGYGQEPEYYALGIEAAGKVIGDPNYRLVASPEEVCTEVLPGNSEEGIFEVCYDDSRGEYKDFESYIGGTVEKWPVLKGTTPASRRKFFIRNETVERLYTPEDLRLQAYFADFFRMKEEPVSVTQGAAYVRMWREVEYYSGGIYDGTPRTLLANDILIRLPDILLLRAEMKAATGDREGAVADLDVVRRRAGVAGYSEAEGDLRRAIQLERDRELLFQTGVRYFDYMRNHTYNLLKGGFRDLTETDVAAGALFLPVSLDAMNNNPKVKQTAYWVGKF